MKTAIAAASRSIHTPADVIYNIIADFRILPKPYFQSLEEGGFGEGTITRFQMSLLGQTQRFRTRISEPEPGRVRMETDINIGTPTTFTVSPLTGEAHTQVTISTELKNQRSEAVIL